MDRKKRIRTKGSNNQWSFDNILSDLKDDELSFMKQKYNKELLDYRYNNDINIQDNAQEYKELQQRKKMIDEEIRNRRIFKSSVKEPEIRFYPNEDTIVDSSNNNIVESITYNWDETEILSLPSGNRGKKEKEEWEPKLNPKDNVIMEFTMMDEVELSWKDWIEKYKLNESISN